MHNRWRFDRRNGTGRLPAQRQSAMDGQSTGRVVHHATSDGIGFCLERIAYRADGQLALQRDQGRSKCRAQQRPRSKMRARHRSRCTGIKRASHARASCIVAVSIIFGRDRRWIGGQWPSHGWLRNFPLLVVDWLHGHGLGRRCALRRHGYKCRCVCHLRPPLTLSPPPAA